MDVEDPIQKVLNHAVRPIDIEKMIGALLQAWYDEHAYVGAPFDADKKFKQLRETFDRRQNGRTNNGTN